MDVYIFQAALLCGRCALETMRQLAGRVIGADYRDSDHYPQGPYRGGGGEADGPQHCDQCQTFLENPLTSDGANYVREALEDKRSDPEVRAEWRAFYDYL